jgi:Dockerin type I domain
MNPWDFYDVNGDKKVDAIDIALVRMRYGLETGDAGYDPKYDRSNSQQWGGPPDGVINAIDIALVRAQFSDSCRDDGEGTEAFEDD